LEKTKEALMTFVNEMKRIKKVIFAAVGQDEMSSSAASSSGSNLNILGDKSDVAAAGNDGGKSPTPSQNMDVLLKRLMKFKHLEEDNKKLKNLLK